MSTFWTVRTGAVEEVQRIVPQIRARWPRVKIVLRVEEEVKPFWSKSGALKRRWRDATLMDLAAPEMRHLIDLRFRPHLRS